MLTVTICHIYNIYHIWGLTFYEDVVDTMELGCKLFITKVILFNFKEPVMKFVFTVTVGSHFEFEIFLDQSSFLVVY